MKPEAQRIAIALVDGWELKRCAYHGCDTWHCPSGICADGSDYAVLPNYPSDLNAMQEAVIQNRDELGGYCMELRRIVRRDTPEEYDVYGDINYYHATATQRAEAFLRTLNLWTDDACIAQKSE